MKKILKYVSLFIVTIALMFGLTKNAMAADCGDESSEFCRVGQRGVIKAGGNGFYHLPFNQSTSNKAQYVGYLTISGGSGKYSKYTDAGLTAHFGSKKGTWVLHNYQDAYSALFCLDAQYEGQLTLRAERFLLNSSASVFTNAFDYAIMHILTDGGIITPTSNMSASNTSWYSNYSAKLMAIRGVTYVFGWSNQEYIYDDSYYAYRNTVYNWYKQDASGFNALNDALKAANKGSLTTPTVVQSGSYYISGNSTLTMGKNYFNNALKAAAEYVKTASEGVNVKSDSITPDQDVTIETTPEGERVSKNIVHTLKVSGLTNNGRNKFIINGIKFAEDMKYDNLDYKIESVQIGDTLITDFETIKGKNLLELGYDFTNETIIKITVHFEGWKSKADGSTDDVLKCSQAEIKYYIDGLYTTDEFGEFSKYVATVWYSGTSKRQRFIGIEAANGENDNEESLRPLTENTTKLIDECDCQEIVDACIQSNNVNSEECQELKDSNCGECDYLDAVCKIDPNNSLCGDHYAEACAGNCEPFVDKYDCCDTADELIVSATATKETKVLGLENGDDDNKACFVGKIDSQTKNGDNTNVEGIKDSKGNTYTLAKMKPNKYCTVSCKEDYIMNMPTAKLVNAGRYFTFRASVKGTKTCYTNTISREVYNKDLAKDQRAMIDAYNKYKSWEKANEVKNPDSEDIRSIPTGANPGACSCGFINTNVIMGTYTGDYQYEGVCIDSTPEEEEKTGVVRSHKCTLHDQKGGASDIDSNGYGGSTTGSPCTPNPKTGICSGGCSASPCKINIVKDEYTLSDLQADIDKGLETEKANLAAAQESYHNTIKQYNECSTWSSDIEYKPDIYYDYEENYLTKFYGDHGEMIESKTETGPESWYCNSSVSTNGSETVAKLSGTKYDACASSNTNALHYTSIQYTYCSLDNGCSTQNPEGSKQDISDARYKKYSTGVEANYRPKTLFYNVYPSGDIVDQPGDNTTPVEDKEGNGGLPVALNTRRGIYKYTVNIPKLGEFYDNEGTLGRYAGSDHAIVGDILTYNCSYLVNIKETNGWKCDFDDTCTDDCISNCVGPNCEGYCDGTDCVADCIGLGCLYDQDAGKMMNEKTVSLNNLFPNGTESYNWTNEKGTLTKTYIENKEYDNGNEVYASTPVLSVTITPNVSSAIKKYNREQESEGGYSNSTLDCRAIGNYSEIACYSSFISDLIDGKYGKAVNTSLVTQARKIGDNNTEYFTIWDGNVSDAFMIGPSWKIGGDY